MIDVAGLAAALAAVDPPTAARRALAAGRAARAATTTPRATCPGAVFVDLDARLCGPPGRRRPAPAARSGRAARRRCAPPGCGPAIRWSSTTAATAWPRPGPGGRCAGPATQRVRVLDGGFAAWIAAGRPVEHRRHAPAAGRLHGPAGRAAGARRRRRRRAGAATGVLLDVRAPPRYRGETEPIDPVAGHIPGAVNLPTRRARRPARPAPRRATSCAPRSPARGTRRTVPRRRVLRLRGDRRAHRAGPAPWPGRTDAALYVGSWSDWITDPRRARCATGG